MPKMVEEQIADLNKAMSEAKDTIRELHEARSAALDVLKDNRRRITEAIESEVQKQAEALSDEARHQMRKRIGEVIDGIERDWRSALKLD